MNNPKRSSSPSSQQRREAKTTKTFIQPKPRLQSAFRSEYLSQERYGAHSPLNLSISLVFADEAFSFPGRLVRFRISFPLYDGPQVRPGPFPSSSNSTPLNIDAGFIVVELRGTAVIFNFRLSAFVLRKGIGLSFFGLCIPNCANSAEAASTVVVGCLDVDDTRVAVVSSGIGGRRDNSSDSASALCGCNRIMARRSAMASSD